MSSMHFSSKHVGFSAAASKLSCSKKALPLYQEVTAWAAQQTGEAPTWCHQNHVMRLVVQISMPLLSIDNNTGLSFCCQYDMTAFNFWNQQGVPSFKPWSEMPASSINSEMLTASSNKFKSSKPSYNHIRLVVSTPLKNISQLGWLFPIFPNIWKNKKCSKAPTRYTIYRNKTSISDVLTHLQHLQGNTASARSPWPCWPLLPGLPPEMATPFSAAIPMFS